MKNGASALILSEDKILLFLRDNIQTIPYPDCWSFPGGQIEQGESPDEAIRRELQEEVSYVPRNLSSVGYIVNKNNIVYVYLAFVDNDEEKLFSLGIGEGQKIKFFGLHETNDLKLTAGAKYYLTRYKTKLAQIMKNKQIPEASFLDLKNR